MPRYTNILTGHTILVSGTIKGKNWELTENINELRKQAKEAKEEAEAKKEEVKEEVEEQVAPETQVDIPSDLEGLTNADLGEILFEMGVEFNNRATKAELIKLIEDNR